MMTTFRIRNKMLVYVCKLTRLICPGISLSKNCFFPTHTIIDRQDRNSADKNACALHVDWSHRETNQALNLHCCLAMSATT